MKSLIVSMILFASVAQARENLDLYNRIVNCKTDRSQSFHDIAVSLSFSPYDTDPVAAVRVWNNKWVQFRGVRHFVVPLGPQTIHYGYVLGQEFALQRIEENYKIKVDWNLTIPSMGIHNEPMNCK